MAQRPAAEGQEVGLRVARPAAERPGPRQHRLSLGSAPVLLVASLLTLCALVVWSSLKDPNAYWLKRMLFIMTKCNVNVHGKPYFQATTQD